MVSKKGLESQISLKSQELNQVNQFLGLLGHKDNDTVYLRHINPVTGYTFKTQSKYPLRSLPQKKNTGTYFVVNGQGQCDKDIINGRAVWIEHDDLEKSDQLILWQKYNLPEPTIQVDTSGKSIHSYWVFTQEIPIDIWRSIQEGLIKLTNCDKSVRNPSRVLRLPNCDYIDKKTGKTTGKVKIVGGSGIKVKPLNIQKVLRENESKQVYIPRTDNGFKQIVLSQEKTDQWVAKALEHIDPDCGYDDWFNIGVSLVVYYGENEGLKIWDNWSSKGSKYRGYSELERKVKSFDLTQCKGIGLLFNIAQRYGFNYVPKSKDKANRNRINLDDLSDRKVRSFLDLITKPREIKKPNKINTLADTTYSTDDDLIEIIKDENNKLIVMIDPTGLGKTTTISKNRWKLHNLAVDKFKETIPENERYAHTKPAVFYIDQGHNNPTDEIIERDFYNLEPRAKTWKLDDSKKTPNGLSYRQASIKDDGMVEGNCERAGLFVDAINKGLKDKIFTPTVVKYSNGYEKIANNQICATCPKLGSCSFLSDRLSVLGHPKEIMEDGVKIDLYQKGSMKERKPLIRCDSLQVTEVLNPWDIAVIDEFDKQLITLKSHSFGQNQLDQDFAFIVHKYSDIEEKIKPLFIVLKDCFEDAKSEYYQLDHDRIMARIEALDLDFAELLELWEKQIQWQEELIREYQREDLFGDTSSDGYNFQVINNAIGLILEAIVKDEPMRMTMDRFGKLTIFKKNGFNYHTPYKTIGLTATPLPKSIISKATGISEENIIFVARETYLTTDNLTVKVIKGIKGIGSNEHTKKGQERMTAFAKQQLDLPNTLLSGHKKYRQDYELNSHYWGNDERGANLYQDKKSVAFLGLPYEHLGQAKITYELLTNSYSNYSEKEFERFKRSLMENNIIQRIGRLRAIRRNEELTAYIICKDLDTEFLLKNGYQVQESDVTDTEYLELMTPRQRVIYTIKHYLPCYVAECVKKNVLPCLDGFIQHTQDTFKISKSEISKAVNSLSLGFVELRKIFQSLITLYKENGKFLKSKIETVFNTVGNWFKDRFTNTCSDLGLMEKEEEKEKPLRESLPPPPKKQFRWLPSHTNLLYELLGDLEILVKRSDYEQIKRKYGQEFLEYCLSEYVSDNLISKLSVLGCF
ncbi:PriCT-2 domain-containing protein (plasmid) [Cyanobacterium aponinum AL20118]|uniref:PriCT-2 domain-containing protein n=1 Tax=Cyanobacterium aponinum AL20115 TaxID=3090662 RepID=A0AAF0ZKT1_9CHRO|nr:PriCT-2 domain-containing protein [Cyanobacterium aponinum]WPF90512.1 PriCT-2 domain-containing protein [Cyanobacterium aponinum AL20115]